MSQTYRLRDASARALACAVGFGCLGCGSDLGPTGGGTATTPSSATAAPSAAQLSPEGVGPAYGPSWEAARRSEDPADLARLADDEGAATLALGLDHPQFGAVARGALPHAKDAEVALGPLAARILRGAASSPTDLEVVLAILARPPKLGERIDPDGERQAAADLLTVARDSARTPGIRAAAVSALRRMSERGLAVPGEIPTDLDE